MDTRDEQLQCPSCGAIFGLEELGVMVTTPDGRSYIVCPECNARNEIQMERGPDRKRSHRIVNSVD